MTSGQSPSLIKVAVARPVTDTFTYLVPAELSAARLPGMRLKVPFGRGQALGFSLGPADEPSAEVRRRLKPVAQVLEATPALDSSILALAGFASTHYRHPLGEVLKAALPPGLNLPRSAPVPRESVGTTIVELLPEVTPDALKRAPALRATLTYLQAVGGVATIDQVAMAVDRGRANIRKLLERGFLRLTVAEPSSTDVSRSVFALGAPPIPTPEQAAALATLEEALKKQRFQTFLLHGVTGSGKTEVYLRLVANGLARRLGALILVPEIALTPQLIGRFQARFGQKVALLHSGLKDSERLAEWQRLRRGAAKIAVGVRSAVWAPVQDLGIIIVDEEHDSSFKQEEKLRYQARDLAVVRAQQSQCLVVLGSATPSLESLENVRRNRYQIVELLHRVDDRPMPSIEVIDLRKARPRQPEATDEAPVLSLQARDAIAATLASRQQVILFLNRRGHATFVTCEVCGASVRCTDCDVCLTFHLSTERLECHYCGKWQPLPRECVACGGPLLQLGLGTERIERELAEAFPQARIARLDRDAAKSASDITDILTRFANRELDLLVGTQMVAKGHDFPGVTLVCVVLADGTLALPDFRAAERTFQLLTQVAGRAGRGEDLGRVLVQSYNPEAAPIAAMVRGDFAGFSELELSRRRALRWPPFARLVAVRIEGPVASEVARLSKDLAKAALKILRDDSTMRNVALLGPTPAPLRRIKGNSRWQFVLKGPTHAALTPLVAAVEAAAAGAIGSTKVTIDVDPVAML